MVDKNIREDLKKTGKKINKSLSLKFNQKTRI